MRQAHAYRGEFAQAESAAKRLLTMRSWQPTALRMLRDADLRAGTAALARARYAAAYPELLTSEVPALDLSSARAAIDLALVLQTTGEDSRARVLLDRAEEIMRWRGPMSWFGHSLPTQRSSRCADGALRLSWRCARRSSKGVAQAGDITATLIRTLPWFEVRPNPSGLRDMSATWRDSGLRLLRGRRMRRLIRRLPARDRHVDTTF